MATETTQKSNNPFDYTDKVIRYMERKLIRLFNRHRRSILKFDEVNALKEISAMYEEAYAIALDGFRKIARHYYGGGYVEYYLWLTDMLNKPNDVTKYNYNAEFTRKEERLKEALISSTESGGVSARRTEYDKGLKYITSQINIYADLVTDEANIEKLKAEKAKKVKWQTEHDEKVCHICRERDGTIYDIREVPPKPHPYCRCWLEKI